MCPVTNRVLLASYLQLITILIVHSCNFFDSLLRPRFRRPQQGLIKTQQSLGNSTRFWDIPIYHCFESSLSVQGPLQQSLVKDIYTKDLPVPITVPRLSVRPESVPDVPVWSDTTSTKLLLQHSSGLRLFIKSGFLGRDQITETVRSTK